MGDPSFPGVVGPTVERWIVDQQHVPFRAHDVTQQFAVVPVRGHEVADPHARLDAGEAQNLRGMIERVALLIVGGAA